MLDNVDSKVCPYASRWHCEKMRETFSEDVWNDVLRLEWRPLAANRNLRVLELDTSRMFVAE